MTNTGTESGTRRRRDRDDIREALLEAAIVEFAERGFDGASTRSIAERADAHQPQINYHFSSKAELWRAALDHLFAALDEALQADGRGLVPGTGGTPAGLSGPATEPTAGVLAEGVAELIARFAAFSAERPELHQIMTHEATRASDRLDWLVETHVRRRHRELAEAWAVLVDAGIAAPIDPELVYWVLIGATSLPFLSIAEARAVLAADPADPTILTRHVTGLVAMLLPGLR